MIPPTKYLYLNTHLNGVPGANIRATLNVNRLSPVIKDTTGWIVSAERWSLHGVKLPLFDTEVRDIKLAFKDSTTGTITPATVTFAGVGRYLYDYRDLAHAITNTMVAAFPGDPSDTPMMSFSDGKFSFTTTAGFRADYELLVSDVWEFYFGTFDLYDNGDAGWLELILSGDVETQSDGTIEFLSPVARFAIETVGLPVVMELLQPSAGASAVANQESSILVDYRITQQTNQSTLTINYVASGDHRWHTMLPGSSFQSFTLTFHWVDYENKLTPLTLGENAFAEVKMAFVNGVPMASG